MHLYHRVKKLRPNVPDEHFTIREKYNGSFITRWESSEPQPTQEEIDSVDDSKPDYMAWAELRAERDRLLAETDWWVLPDRTASAEQLAYRQALRDITNQADPANPVWPNKPEV